MPVNAASFRDALARVPAPVTIITTLDWNGRPAGFTASAVCSLSLDPPLILVCINTAAGCYPAFRRAERFLVNILASGQEELARRFGTPRVDKFGGEVLTFLDHGLPAISGAPVRLVCALDAILPGGDHSILVGRVQEQARMSAGAPLVYFDRRFHRLEAAATPGRLAGAAGSEVSA